LEALEERHADVVPPAQLLRPAREPSADELVRQLGERVAHDRRVVLPVHHRQSSRHRVVTSDSIRAVYFSYASVSVENWMIFSCPWNGYLRHTSTCGPAPSITLQQARVFPRRRSEETVPALTTNRCSSFHASGTCWS